MITRDEWVHGKATAAEERDLFDAGVISECDYEFGPHEHDDAACAQTLAGMKGDTGEANWIAEQYNRDLEEQALERPLFPNEY